MYVFVESFMIFWTFGLYFLLLPPKSQYLYIHKLVYYVMFMFYFDPDILYRDIQIDYDPAS